MLFFLLLNVGILTLNEMEKFRAAQLSLAYNSFITSGPDLVNDCVSCIGPFIKFLKTLHSSIVPRQHFYLGKKSSLIL